MQEISQPDERLLTRDEVEHRFGVTRRFLEIAAVRGDGPARILIGRSVRYRAADIESWIESRRVAN